MPIANRSIEPVFVSQVKVPASAENEFDYVVNATLCNLIKQIACLSIKANDIFGELASSLSSFVTRAESLEYKIQTINVKIDEMDCSKIQPLVNQQLTIYKSQINRDDELLDHTQMPECIKEMFDQAQAPPELFKFDQFRKKDEESMIFYTDPGFFLKEWLKNARNERKKKRENKKKRKTVMAAPVDCNYQPPLPPPIFTDPVVEEPELDNNPMDYNFGDVAVYEDPTVFIMAPKKINSNDNKRVSKFDNSNTSNMEPIPPPPPIFTSFPMCLPPSPPPPPTVSKAPPSVKNLLLDIQKGSVLKPVSERKEVKEKTRDFRELIQELRPAWDNQSDDSDESED